MRLPLPRRRHRRKTDQASEMLGKALTTLAVLKTARAALPSAKTAKASAQAAHRTPIKKVLLVLGIGGAAAAVARKRSAGKEDPYPSPATGGPVASPAPAPTPITPNPPTVPSPSGGGDEPSPPTDTTLDVDGPNEGAPGGAPDPDEKAS